MPASGGAFDPVDRAGARGLPRQRPPPGRGRGRQHRDVESDRRRRLGGVRPAVDMPAVGQGTMNNRRSASEDVDLLRDARWRSGCLAGRRRAVGRARRDVETLNTPVEALELAYPLRVERYALRRARAGPARNGAATGSSARSGRSRSAACRYSGPASHAPAGARGGEAGRPRPQARERRGEAGQGHAPARGGRYMLTETPGGGGYGPA